MTELCWAVGGPGLSSGSQPWLVHWIHWGPLKKNTPAGAHPQRVQYNWSGVQPGHWNYFKAPQVIPTCSTAGILFKEEEAINREYHDNLSMHSPTP